MLVELKQGVLMNKEIRRAMLTQARHLSTNCSQKVEVLETMADFHLQVLEIMADSLLQVLETIENFHLQGEVSTLSVKLQNLNIQ